MLHTGAGSIVQRHTYVTLKGCTVAIVPNLLLSPQFGEIGIKVDADAEQVCSVHTEYLRRVIDHTKVHSAGTHD